MGGLRVETAIPLCGLPPGSPRKADLELTWSRLPLIPCAEPLVELPGRAIAVTREGRPRYRLRGELEFVLPSRGHVLELWSPRGPGLLLTHEVVDGLIPLVLSERGGLVLHAAGLVRRPGCAIALLGDSGTGKSTLTSRWVAEGGRFLSDDWLNVTVRKGLAYAAPSHPSIRLRPESRVPAVEPDFSEPLSESGYAKRWHSWAPGRPGFRTRACPLARIVVCRRDDALPQAALRSLAPQEALRAILSRTFFLDAGCGRGWQRRLDLLAAVLAKVPVHELAFPSGPEGLAGALAALQGAGRR